MVKLSRGAATVTTGIIGALVLLTTLPVWVRGTTPTATGDLAVSASGTAAAPAAASAGLVIIASALVLGLAGTAVRIVTLIAVTVASIAAGITVLMFAGDPAAVVASAAAKITSVRAVNDGVSLTVWPYVSLATLGLAAITGGWLLSHLGTWQNVGRKYQRPTVPPQEPTSPSAALDSQSRARRQAMDDWDAISRGEDPS